MNINILTGSDALRYAAERDLLLNKFADPIEGAREGLTIEEARDVAREDPSLIWVEARLVRVNDGQEAWVVAKADLIDALDAHGWEKISTIHGAGRQEPEGDEDQEPGDDAYTALCQMLEPVAFIGATAELDEFFLAPDAGDGVWAWNRKL